MNGQSYNPFYSLQNAAARVYAFLDLLDQLGIKDKQSGLYRACIKVLEHHEYHEKPELRNGKTDNRADLQAIMGLNDFIAKILSARYHPQFNLLYPHLRLLPTALIPQTVPADVRDQGSNKLFELYLAILCLHCFSDVEVDSPENSKGDNPDIMFKFLNKKWGIACKVMHSAKVKTILDRIQEGIQQIEHSDADTGIVIISLRNIIEYNDILPLLNPTEHKTGADPVYGAFTNTILPGVLLYADSEKIRDSLHEELGESGAKALFSGKKSAPNVCMFVQASSLTAIGGLPVPTILRMFTILQWYDKTPDETVCMVNHLNNMMHLIQ